MALYRNTQTGDIHQAFGATGDWLLNQEPKGLWVEIEVQDPGQLKGKALDDALKGAELSTSGNVDEKRARLAAHNAEQLAAETGPSPDEPPVDPPTDPSQDQ